MYACEREKTHLYMNCMGIEKPSAAFSLLFRVIFSKKCIKHATIRDDIKTALKYAKNKHHCKLAGDPALWVFECYGIQKPHSDTVGVNIIREGIFLENDGIISPQEAKNAYINIVNELILRGYKVLIFTNGLRADENLAQKVLEGSNLKNDPKALAKRPKTGKELAKIISSCKAIIGTRMHCAIAAVSMDIPCIEVIWKPKQVHFAGLINRSGWFFSVQETFDIGSFANAFNAAACLMVYPVIFLLFGKRYSRLRTDVLYNSHILAVSVCALAVCIVFCSVCNTYAQWSMPLYISCMAFIALFCVFVLLVQSGMLERGKDRHEIAIIRGLLEKEKTQYALTKESIELINIKCHDLRHRLREMRQSGEVSARELEQVERAINVYDSHIETGNGTLDIVLSEQILFCENAGIRLMCAADAEGLSFMSPSDIYSLFGNILENARDAVRKVISPDFKYINFSVRRVADMLIVSEDNHYEGELHFENGLPLTTHANTEDHGFGMKSVRMIVRTYGGDMDISARGGVFRLRIAFALRG